MARAILYMVLGAVFLGSWFWVDPAGRWEGVARVFGVALLGVGRLVATSRALRPARLTLFGSFAIAIGVWCAELARADGGHPFGDHTFAVMLGLTAIMCLVLSNRGAREDSSASHNSRIARLSHGGPGGA